MALYQVTTGRAITVDGRTYTAGEIVDLDDYSASFFEDSVVFADYLWESDATRKNFRIGATGVEITRVPILDQYSLVKSITTAALGVITTVEEHCFRVNDSVVLFDANTCPNSDGNYTVASTPTRTTLTLTGYNTQDHGQLADQYRTILGRYSSDVGWATVAQVFLPATKAITVTESSRLVSEAGSRRIWFESDSPQQNILVNGDLISCPEAGLVNAVVEAIGSWTCRDQIYRMAVQLSATSTATTTDGAWSASRITPTQGIGPVAGIIGTSWSGGNLLLTWPTLPRGSYYYLVQRQVGAVLTDILRGQAEYV